MSEKKDNIFRRLYYGVLKENPTVVLCLGLCPTLAVTTSAKNGLAMGIFTSVVLILSNLFISLLRKLIPQTERILGFVVIIGTFTTLSQLALTDCTMLMTRPSGPMNTAMAAPHSSHLAMTVAISPTNAAIATMMIPIGLAVRITFIIV